MNKKLFTRLAVPATALLVSACATQTPAPVVNGTNLVGGNVGYNAPSYIPENPFNNTSVNNTTITNTGFTPTNTSDSNVPFTPVSTAPTTPVTVPATDTTPPPSSHTHTPYPVYTENSIALPSNNTSATHTASPAVNSNIGYVSQNQATSSVSSTGIHRVEKGDTVFNIAKRYGITTNALVAQNGIQNNHIIIGQTLRINGSQPISKPIVAPKPVVASPSSNTTNHATTHRVEKGDTVFNIAKRYGITTNVLVAQNGIQNNHIIVGQVLQIHNGNHVSTPAAPVQTNRPTPKKPDSSSAPSSWSSPLQGSQISQDFSVNKNNIVLKGSPNQNIQAAADGIILFSGTPEQKLQRQYGEKMIIVRHDNIISVYGNVHHIAVKESQAVKRGQTLAQTGQNGLLSFTIRQDGKSLNPSQFVNLN
ncbi:MAG: LysM peptidoglycan-binding domain-containing protein [Alysiella sp.]|uniref:LysM peptidoglycan-binding domain-containing protein n=1 Tax=Alysiella sp. TaxID=1872483 RepID=UPI0026DBBBE3|nr:LysM peptidoglycan-binding domain-containing protein [Alysiella sp.]MDO4434088.1 LysM peptidoglycan-binding domain-containing protein [Alysiella sp.]